MLFYQSPFIKKIELYGLELDSLNVWFGCKVPRVMEILDGIPSEPKCHQLSTPAWHSPPPPLSNTPSPTTSILWSPFTLLHLNLLLDDDLLVLLLQPLASSLLASCLLPLAPCDHFGMLALKNFGLIEHGKFGFVNIVSICKTASFIMFYEFQSRTFRMVVLSNGMVWHMKERKIWNILVWRCLNPKFWKGKITSKVKVPDSAF